MITRPTVFVLGAGASCSYGFPSGRELIFQIYDRVRKKCTGMVAGGVKHWLGFEIDTVLRCAQELVSSEIPSVDLFLENRQEYRDIGKALIATALIPYEGEKRLERRNEKHEWLEYLFGHMVTKRESFEGNHVSFITFNYDRSVEQFFSKALTSSFGLKQAELQEMLKIVPIVHVHGLLGKLGSGHDARPFSPDVNETSIRIAAAGIKFRYGLERLEKMVG